jgi:hypothetical protein
MWRAVVKVIISNKCNCLLQIYGPVIWVIFASNLLGYLAGLVRGLNPLLCAIGGIKIIAHLTSFYHSRGVETNYSFIWASGSAVSRIPLASVDSDPDL